MRQVSSLCRADGSAVHTCIAGMSCEASSLALVIVLANLASRLSAFFQLLLV